VLNPLPEALFVVRPRALRRDAVYGPLFGRAIQLARQHSKVVAAASTLETIEDADEVLVGVPDIRTVDFVVVVRGVPADVDPASLVDERGRPLWMSASPGPVRELARVRPAERSDQTDMVPQDDDTVDASLFELPGRTWVIATGKACAAARRNLSRATAPSPDDSNDLDPQGVAILRLAGPALVQRVRGLRPPGLLSAIGHELATITVVLSPGSDALLRATFSYNSEQAVLPAETTLRQAISALSDAKPQTFAWLRASTTRTSRCCVLVATPLPAPLLDALVASDAGL
jgi:hypothetical protein